jgi:O-antigen ligase
VIPARPTPRRGTANGVPRPSQAPAAPHLESDLLLKLAFGFFVVDLFVSVSRFLEILNLAGNIRVPYLGVTFHVVTLVLALISGGARRVVASGIGVYLAFFTGWMMVCTLVSTWRGESADTLARDWVPSLIIFASCGTVVTLVQCKKVATVLAAAVALIAAASFSLGTIKEDRLSFQSGTLGGANELAMLLLLGAPFFLVPILSKSSSRFSKLVAIGLGIAVLIPLVRSASRGGLLAVILILTALFWIIPFAGKMKLGLLSLVLMVLFFTVTPREVLSRYSTIFSDAQTGDEVALSAQESSQARQYLLQQSLKLTMQHPIFGLGPGVFVVGESQLAEAEGQKAAWHVSHNSYTQVSSEMGIPGLLLYLAALWCTFRNVFWFRSRSGIDPTGRASAVGLALFLSLIGLCVSLTFSSSAYLFYLPMLMGLSVAFRNSLQLEIDRQAYSPVLTAPSPAPPKTRPGKPATTSSGKPVYRFLGRSRRSGA